MSSDPSTPVRIPKAATTYTPSTQDPDLRSSINHELLRGGHIIKIQETLLHSLHASPTNWPTLIQNHALSILRSGDCHTFPELMSRVMQDIKKDTEQIQMQGLQSNGGGKGGLVNGKEKDKERDRLKGKGSGEGGVSLALPQGVVEEGVRVTRECLETVCEV